MSSETIVAPSGSGLELPTGMSRRISVLMIVASLSVITAKLMDAPVLRSANDRSRWCTVWALVERNTYVIDEIRQQPGWDTIDKVRHNDHFYSSKPPLLPRLVAEIYRGLKAITGWTLLEQTGPTTRTILFLINILPMGLALLAFSNMIERYSRDLWTHLFIVACACWATLLLPFLTVFNNHTIAATCYFALLPLVMRIVVEHRESTWRFVACGLLAAFGVCNELPSAIFGICLFFLLLHHNPKTTLLAFAPASALVFALFFLTNYQATGSLQPFYARYGTETYEFVHEGVPSYWADPKGVDKPRDSTATYLLHCLVGHHGVLSLTPVLLLTLTTWLFPPLFWASRLRIFHLFSLGLTFSTLGFYLTKTENYNYGGVSIALRWMLWLTPFWLVSMLPILTCFSRRTWFRTIALVLLSVSIFSAWYPANGPWTQSWLYQWMASAKLIDYTDPPPKFQKLHYTWLGSLPTGERQEDYSITFMSIDPDGTRVKLRLRDGGPVEPASRLITVSRISDRNPETQEVGYVIDTAKFNAGRPVEEFLIQRHDGSAVTEEDLSFFRGMPKRMQYVSSRIRYEKTPLRTDAFRCHVGYTYVTIQGEDGASRKQIRDIWYSEEVPFGILKWEDRIERDDKQTVSRQLWQPSEAGKFLERLKASPF